MKGNAFTQKLVSGVVVIIFTIFSVLTSVPGQAFSDTTALVNHKTQTPAEGGQVKHKPTEFKISSEVGSIEESFEGKQGSVVYYIQDAHTSLEAQENIAKIISSLIEKKGVKQVYVEGFAGPEKLDDLFQIQDSLNKRQAAYFFMDYLRLSGAEYAYVTRDQEFDLVGIENYSDYLANIKDYELSAEYREIVGTELDDISKQLKLLASRLYPREIKTYQKLKTRFENKKISLADYIFRVMRIYYGGARSETGELRDYSALSLIVENLGKKKLTKKEEEELNQRLEEVDAKVFFEELKNFENDFTSKYLKDPIAKKTFEYQNSIELLQKLNNLQLTPEDYCLLTNGRQPLPFTTAEVAHFLAEHLKKPLLLKNRWEVLIQNSFAFYNQATSRDTAFKLNLEKALFQPLSTNHYPPVILVTGGFHKDALTEFFKEKGISYRLISPRITKLDPRHEKRYEFLMSGKFYDFEKPFLSAAAALIQKRLVNLVLEGADIPMLVQAAALSIDKKTGLVDLKKMKANYAILKTRQVQAVVEKAKQGVRTERRVPSEEMAAAKSLGEVADSSWLIADREDKEAVLSDEEYENRMREAVKKAGAKTVNELIQSELEKRKKVVMGFTFFAMPAILLAMSAGVGIMYSAPEKILSLWLPTLILPLIIVFALYVHEVGHWIFAKISKTYFKKAEFHPLAAGTVLEWENIDAPNITRHIFSGLSGPAANLIVAGLAYGAIFLTPKESWTHTPLNSIYLMNLLFAILNAQPFVGRGGDGRRLISHLWSELILKRIKGQYSIKNLKRFDASYLYIPRTSENRDFFETDQGVFIIRSTKKETPPKTLNVAVEVNDVILKGEPSRNFFKVPAPIQANLEFTNKNKITFNFGFEKYAVYRIEKENPENKLFYEWLRRARAPDEIRGKSLGAEEFVERLEDLEDRLNWRSSSRQKQRRWVKALLHNKPKLVTKSKSWVYDLFFQDTVSFEEIITFLLVLKYNNKAIYLAKDDMLADFGLLPYNRDKVYAKYFKRLADKFLPLLEELTPEIEKELFRLGGRLANRSVPQYLIDKERIVGKSLGAKEPLMSKEEYESRMKDAVDSSEEAIKVSDYIAADLKKRTIRIVSTFFILFPSLMAALFLSPNLLEPALAKRLAAEIIPLWAGTVLGMFFHEFGHWFVAKSLKEKIKSVKVYPFGGITYPIWRDIDAATTLNYIMLSLGGTLANLIIASISYSSLLFIPKETLFYSSAANIGLANLAIVVLNMLPWGSVDAGKLIGQLWSEGALKNIKSKFLLRGVRELDISERYLAGDGETEAYFEAGGEVFILESTKIPFPSQTKAEEIKVLSVRPGKDEEEYVNVPVQIKADLEKTNAGLFTFEFDKEKHALYRIKKSNPANTLFYEWLRRARAPDEEEIFRAEGKSLGEEENLIQSLKLLNIAGIRGDADNLNFSPDGKLLSLMYDDGISKVFDLATGKDLEPLIGADTSYVKFSPDSRLLFATYADHTSRVIDLAEGRDLGLLIGPYASLAIFSPDSTLLSVRYTDFTNKVFNLTTKKDLNILTGRGVSMAIPSPDNRLLYVKYIGKGGNKLFDLATGNVAPLSVGADAYETSFSSDGRLLAAKYGAGNDGTARVFDLAKGNAIPIPVGTWLSTEMHNVYTLNFLPGSNLLHIRDDNYRGKILDIAAKKQLEFNTGSNVWEIRFSSDGKLCFVKYNDNTAKVINRITGEELPIPVEHDKVWITFSPNSKLLFVGYGYADKTGKIFDLITKESFEIPIGSNVANAEFSSDGKFLSIRHMNDTNNTGQVLDLDFFRGNPTMKQIILRLGDDAFDAVEILSVLLHMNYLKTQKEMESLLSALYKFKKPQSFREAINNLLSLTSDDQEKINLFEAYGSKEEFFSIIKTFEEKLRSTDNPKEQKKASEAAINKINEYGDYLKGRHAKEKGVDLGTEVGEEEIFKATAASLGDAVETRVKFDQAKGLNQIFDVFDPKQVEVDVVYNPKPTGRFRFSHTARKGGFGETDWRTMEALSEDIDQVLVPWEKLLKDVSREAASQGKNVYSYSAGNLYNNDWFVLFDGETKQLYHSRGEPFNQRTYSMFVVWNDGSASAEDLRFRQEIDGTFNVFRADNFDEELSGKIKSAVFGQQLISSGKKVPIAEIGHQFEDLYQLFNFPQGRDRDRGKAGTLQFLGQMEIGIKEMRGGIERPNEPEDHPLLKQTLKNDGYMAIDLTPYLMKTPEGHPYSSPLEYIEEKVLKEKHYTRVSPKRSSRLGEGEYFIDGNTLHIRLIWHQYPHNLIGITQSGRVVSVVLPGNKNKGQGYRVKDLANIVGGEFRKDPIGELFLFANSRDVFKAINGVTDEGVYSDDAYREGTAMIAFTAEPDPLESKAGELYDAPVYFMQWTAEATQKYLLEALRQNKIVQRIVENTQGKLRRIRIQSQKGYAYKNLFRGVFEFEGGAVEKFDIELYGRRYGINPEERLTLEQSVAAQIINLARSFDAVEAKELFDELGLGEELTYTKLMDAFRSTFREAITHDTFSYRGQGSDAMVWANQRKNYVVKSLMPGDGGARFRHYQKAKEGLGGIGLKYTLMSNLQITANSGLQLFRVRADTPERIVYDAKDAEGNYLRIEKEKEGTAAYRIQIFDEEGNKINSFEPLQGGMLPSDFGYEIIDVFPNKGLAKDLPRDALLAQIKIQQAVVQKFAPILMEPYDDPETGKTRYRGIFVDLMREGKTREILYLIDLYVALIRDIWGRDFLEFNFDWDNVAFDPSFGELAFIDFGKTTPREEAGDGELETSQMPIHLGQFARYKLETALKQEAGTFQEGARVLAHYDEVVKDKLKIQTTDDFSKYGPSWLEKDSHKEVIGPFDNKIAINYFGPGKIRQNQLRLLAARIRNMIRYNPTLEPKLRHNLAQMNAENEKYFVDILSLLIPEHVDVNTSYIFSNDDTAQVVTRIFPSSEGVNLRKVLDEKKFQGKILSQRELKKLRQQVVKIIINFFSYNRRLYKHIAEKIPSMNPDINPDNPIELDEETHKINELPPKEAYEEVLGLLKIKANYERDTVDSFRKKILHGLRVAKHKKSFPSSLDLANFEVRKNAKGEFRVVLRNFGPLLLHRREFQIYKKIKGITGLSFAEIADIIVRVASPAGAFSFFERIYYQAPSENPVRGEIDKWVSQSKSKGGIISFVLKMLGFDKTKPSDSRDQTLPKAQGPPSVEGKSLGVTPAMEKLRAEAIQEIDAYYDSRVDLPLIEISKSDSLVNLGAFHSSLSEDVKLVADRFLRDKKEPKILDLGYGLGKAAAIFSLYGKVKGNELNPKYVKLSKGAIGDLGKKGLIDKSKMMLEEKNFWDEDFSEFDLIYIYWPFGEEQTPKMRQEFETKLLMRPLKPGAVFVINSSLDDARLTDKGILEQLKPVEGLPDNIRAYQMQAPSVTAQSLGYQASAQLRADIEREVKAPLRTFIHIEDLKNLSKKDLDELLFYVLRGQVGVIVYGGKESGLTLAEVSPDLAQIKKGVQYYFGDEEGLYGIHSKDYPEKIIHLSKDVDAGERTNNLRFRYQKDQTGTLTAAIAYLINDGRLEGIVVDEKGYFVLDLTQKLAELVKEYQAGFELAKAA